MDISGLPPSLLQRIFPGDHTFTNQNKQTLISRILTASFAMRPQLPTVAVAPPLTEPKPISKESSVSREEIKSADPHASVDSTEKATALVKAIVFDRDAVLFFASLLRLLNGTTNRWMLEAFSNEVGSLTREHQDLPGIPKGTHFDSISAFINAKEPSSVAAFIGSQAVSALLRCREALNMNKLQSKIKLKDRIKETRFEQIIAAIKLVRTWVHGIELPEPDVLKESLIAIYWICKDTKSLKKKLPQGQDKETYDAFYTKLMERGLDDLFIIVAEVSSDQPTSKCVETLPTRLFTSYNRGQEFPELVLDLSYWNEMKRILSEASESKKSSLLRTCLLFLLFNCDLSYLDEENLNGFNLGNTFNPVLFKDLSDPLAGLTTRIFLNKKTTETLDTFKVGKLLIAKHSSSPVVTTALLLLMIDLLEKNSGFGDDKEIENVLFLMTEIYPFIEQLPLVVRNRATKALAGLFSRYDQIQEARNGGVWSQLKDKYHFTDCLSKSDFAVTFTVLSLFNCSILPLTSIKEQAALEATSEASDFTHQLKLLSDDTVHSLLTHVSVRSCFRPITDENGDTVALVTATQESVLDEEFSDLIKLYLYDPENSHIAFANKDLRQALHASAAALLNQELGPSSEVDEDAQSEESDRTPTGFETPNEEALS